MVNSSNATTWSPDTDHIMHAKSLPTYISAILSLSFAGCATLHFPWDDKVPEASTKNPVVQITCLWEPSEGRDPDGMPCRGFAGQILFLGNKGGTPVKVDGAVMIYLFDDQGSPEEQAVPIHQYNFDAVSWSQHMRMGTLGPAYHVFIPYTRKGAYESNCSLRVKLTPKNGSAVIYSDPSEVPLRGKKRNSVQTAEVISHHGKRPEGQTAEGTRTTTIPLNGREPSDPATNEEFDQERANFLLQQFLLEQTKRDMDRAQQSSAINRGATSERLRWDGEAVERISPTPQRSLAHLLPETEAEVARGDHPLSSHPFAEHPEPAPKRIKGMARRHPLEDEAAYPIEPRVVGSAEVRSDWTGEDDANDPLNGQTSQYDGRP
jgi:hypothetical protein